MATEEGQSVDALSPEITQEMLEEQLKISRRRTKTQWRNLFFYLAGLLTMFAVGVFSGARLPLEASDFLALFIVCLLVVPLVGYLLVRIYLERKIGE